MENKIPYQVIKEITNNYDKARILGNGGFGTVYKGVYENGETIAVKVFDGPRIDDIEFQKEFNNLKILKHQNIVQLVGFCNETEEVVYAEDNGNKVTAEKLHTALCLEYVQKGHLGGHISDESTGLHWNTRYKIIKGICEGLKFLREGISPPILHLDLKPENILLDKDMIPKVADFGLSRLFGEEKTTKTASDCGTIGYKPPEFIEFQVISEKFDIYSLGVIMTKIITGRDRFFKIAYEPRKEFINKVHNKWKKRLRQDLTSGVEVYCQQVRRCTELALDCMEKNSQLRPTIQEIVSNLTETEIMISNIGFNIRQFPHGESIVQKIDTPENPFSENGPNTITSETHQASNQIAMNAPAKEMTFKFLVKITHAFSEERKIGEHSFGAVYKGILEDGKVIAVVKFERDSLIGRDRAFTDKVQSFSTLKHENIVNILGYCREERRNFVVIEGRYVAVDTVETLLCHEYFAAGNLAEYIHGESCSLDWRMRFKMIVGICRGLHFLHTLPNPVIHTDLKPENIFLDNYMEPKIFNFGQSRQFYAELTRMRTRGFVGSIGYMAPEYLYMGEISSRTDIYSLGIIILEIVTGERNQSSEQQKSSRKFIDKVEQYWRLEQIMSKYPEVEEDDYYSLELCIRIGLMCVELDQNRRPSTGDIIEELQSVSMEPYVPKEGYCLIQEEVVKHELLEVHPRELCFQFEPRNNIYCSLQLRNKGDDKVAFMLNTSEIAKMTYLTKLPLCGIVPPKCIYTHTIRMRKPTHQPSDSGEFFTLHTVAVANFDLQGRDKNSIAEKYGDFFNKAKERNGDEVQEVTLAVTRDPAVQEPTRSIIEIITAKNAQQVSSVDVHPTEPWIMTTHKGGSLHIFDYTTMELLVSFEEIIEESVHVAKFVEREKWLVAGDADGGIHVYSYHKNKVVQFLQAHYSCIASLALHPTRPFLLSSSKDDHLIKLWDWDNNWQCTRTFQGHADEVMQVTFNSNSMDSFTSVSLGGLVKIWSIDNDDRDIVTLDEKDGGLLCVDNFIRRDRQHLIVGCMDGTAQIWNTGNKACVQNLEGHAERITAVNLHPELPMLITGSFDGTVRLWNSDTYKILDIIDFNLGQVYAFGFIKDLRRIVVGCQQGLATMEISMR